MKQSGYLQELSVKYPPTAHDLKAYWTFIRDLVHIVLSLFFSVNSLAERMIIPGCLQELLEESESF